MHVVRYVIFSGLEVPSFYTRPSAHADRLLMFRVSISVSFFVIINLVQFCILLLRQPLLVTATSRTLTAANPANTCLSSTYPSVLNIRLRTFDALT